MKILEIYFTSRKVVLVGHKLKAESASRIFQGHKFELKAQAVVYGLNTLHVRNQP